MEIPEFMYGRYSEVKKRCNKILKELKKGASWDEVTSNLPMIDTKENEGYIVMDGPSSLLKDENHFHMFVFLTLLYDKDSLEDRAEEIFYEHLKTSWGTLSLMSGRGGAIQLYFIPIERHIPFLNSVLRFWEEYISEEKIFTCGSRSPDYIWSLQTNIKFVLARRGVPTEILRAPLPNNDLEALVKRYNLI